MIPVETKVGLYTRVVRAELPPELFRRVPGRLVWLAVHVALAAAGITVIALRLGGVWAAVPASLAVGSSFGVLAFVAHEILHGAVIRDRRAQLVLGGLGFLPFLISPRLWKVWHNQAHHGRTMSPKGIDPDAGGLLSQYRESRAMRIFDNLTVGRFRPLGVLLFLVGFTAQGLRVLLGMARQLNYLSPKELMWAAGETIFAVFFWAALGFALGGERFLLAYVVPLMIGNMVVMSYILTNHNLSPLTATNDPLLNSLSVRTPRAMQWLHLNFGLHVEHHLFPSMSACNAEKVRDVLQHHWPERYQSMPLHRALIGLWTTARVYADNQTLIDPRSGREWRALQPGAPEKETQL